MIGLIDNKIQLEFKDFDEMATKLGEYGDGFGCGIVLLVSTQDKIRAVIKNGKFTQAVNEDMLTECRKYYIYGDPTEYADLHIGDDLPKRKSWPILGYMPFVFGNVDGDIDKLQNPTL